MLRTLRGLSGFISIERGFMLFAISVAATFLLEGKFAWQEATYVGLLVFCGWSAVDAINNVCDAGLDTKSDPSRAQYTKHLGRSGLVICLILCALTLGLGIATLTPLVVVFILLAGVAGLLYSVPPFRLRQTICKPVVNFCVGAFPVLIVAALSNRFSGIWSLVFVVGLATAINSLWEDLADYGSDLESGARTIPIVLGLRRGLYATIVGGYCLFPFMVLVGLLFHLSILYYIILFSLTAYISIRLVLERSLLFGSTYNEKAVLKLAQTLAKDFVIIAVVFSTSLMFSAIMKYQELTFWNQIALSVMPVRFSDLSCI